MKQITCVIVGAGYAGIHAVKSILKAWNERSRRNRIRLILMDKQPYHLRKVLLFKPAAGVEDITIPLDRIFPDHVHIVQGEVTEIERGKKQFRYQDAQGEERLMDYDYLVVAVGSIVRKPSAEQGGIALTGVDSAIRIREQWRENMRKAVAETDLEECQRLLTIVIAGAGISGIETSAELAQSMKAEAANLGLNPEKIRIHLINAQERLFQEGPKKVGGKLELLLNDYGVQVHHQKKALWEKDGVISLSSGEIISAGLCVWTLGLLPNPMLRSIGLPLTSEGQVTVDSSYRVQGAPGVYSIGDCAHITDPLSGRADQKTCKEGIAQATRLGKIILADIEGRPAPAHRAYGDGYCFGLGPERGLVWVRYWGIDMMISGKLGWKIRKLTWDSGSLVK